MTQTSTNKSATPRVCPECGGLFTSPHSRKRFCTPAHKQAYANREAAQGKVIASLAKAWRLKRGSGDTAKAAFAEMCRILDMFNAEDRAAKRPAAPVYVESLLAEGFQYIDRARR